MSAFSELRATLKEEVFAQFGDTATRTGYAKPFRACLSTSNAEQNGAVYPVATVMVYIADAALAIGERITINGAARIIDGILRRDELTITYILRD